MTDQPLPAPHPSRVAELFNHSPVRRLEELRKGRTGRAEQMGVVWNCRIGLFITAIVGTMWAAYLFTGIALISLPSALKTGDIIIIISWIAQTFLQLVLLPIIIVGQNI